MNYFILDLLFVAPKKLASFMKSIYGIIMEMLNLRQEIGQKACLSKKFPFTIILFCRAVSVLIGLLQTVF